MRSSRPLLPARERTARIYAVLKGSFALIVARPGRLKNVPGRKTDESDATWYAMA